MSASIILASLKPELAGLVSTLISKCLASGVVIVPYCGLRTIQDQAKLWRQSRSSIQINAAVADLISKGAPFLASVLDGVGPQAAGPWATNALPGEGWHNWGEAVDCYVESAGKPDWAATAPGYAVYADCAESIGLTAGARWKHPDTDHVQLRVSASPLDAGMTWPEIDAAMKA